MRFIKFLLISGLVLFIVLTLLSLLFPSRISVSRVINVAAPRQKVYTAVSDLRTWNSWNGFIRGASLTGERYGGPFGKEGATLVSDQLVIREGASDTGEVMLEWIPKGGKRTTGGFRLMHLNQDSLTVQWWFDFHFRWYPWEKLGIFVYDRKFGPLMEESLKGLKQYVESP